MGRRKKEPPDIHRTNIALAAETLFEEKGIEAATVDEIAKTAGYSKATVYVYFKNKEEIVEFLVLESMKKLYACICQALKEHQGTRDRYDGICKALVQYQEQFPFYFHMALQEINVDLESPDTLPEEKEIFSTGEEINKELAGFVQAGILAGELRPEIEILPTVFSFWAMMSGLAEMAAHKENYIKKAMGLSRQEFL